MRIAQVILAAGTLAAATPAIAAQWFYIGENETGIAYLDTDSIVAEDDLKTFDAFIAFFDPVGDNADISFIIATFEVDCDASTSALLRSEGFDRSRKPLGIEEVAGAHEPIEPNTMGDLYYSAVCLDIMADAISVEDPFEDASGGW